MQKNLLLVCVCMTISSIVWSQAIVPDDVYRNVDAAIAEQSTPKLEAILGKSSSMAWYPRLETYTLKKARQMVIQNQLDEAKALSLALIDNNLDNKDAVDLYQSVQSAITKRDSGQKKSTESDTVTAYKKQAAEAKIKQDLPKTYKTVTNTATGKKVYLDQDFNNHYSTNTWDLMLGLANINAVYGPEGLDLKYGLSAAGSFFYHSEDFTIGADIIGDGMMLTLSGAQGLNWSGTGIASVASNKLNKYLVLRAGYGMLGYNYGSKTVKAAIFKSPIVGLGFRDVKMGESGRFQMALDYFPGYLSQSDMKLAMGANMMLSFVLADMQDFDIHLHTGVKDTVLMYSTGLVNDAKLIIAVGVGNYE